MRARDARRAIVLGIGGGGDVVGALAIARQIESLGCEVTLGGVAWERLPVDPLPGPRPLEQTRGARMLGRRAALADPGTPVETVGGARFSESQVAEFLGRATLLIDVSAGAAGAAEGIAAAAAELEADLLVCADIGGDAIAHGGDPGLASPLCDAVVLAAAAMVPALSPVVAVAGAGCDGELSPALVLERVAGLAAAGAWLGARGVTTEEAAEIERAAATAFTEASVQVARCARGETGPVPIRNGRRSVELGPVGAIAFYFDLARALPELPLARAVAGSASIEAGRDALNAIGVGTELDFEQRRTSAPGAARS